MVLRLSILGIIWALNSTSFLLQKHCQTKAMKDQILTELASPISKVRVIFATVVMGMGVDVPEI